MTLNKKKLHLSFKHLIMKLPSLHSLWLHTLKVFLRFPLQVFLTIIATCICWYLIDVKNYRGALQINLSKFLFISNLALTLLLASDLFAEAKKYNPTRKWILRFLALLICVGLYFTLNPSQNEADIYRFILLGFAFHLLASFSPFIGNNNLTGFWHYNKILFLRFLTAVLYSVVLYAGLAIALAAIDGLFDVTVNYQIYLKLLALVGICFTTVFFLAGLPDDFDALNSNQTYPKGLKIFTQYVLIPLVTIYLAILLVYEIKIILSWQLPKGLVSTLILGYAVFGILSLLLIYPIKNNDGNGWMKLFSRFFYVMMLPLVVLLILAIVKRVGSYGITEPRYYLIILALWLTAITIYFLLSKNKNIKIIPISLCILAILSIYGPQSAFSVSKISQISRLKNLMSLKLKIVDDEKDQASVIKYLVQNHGLVALQDFTKVDLVSIENKLDKKNTYDARYEKIDTAFAILKVKQYNFNSNWTQITAEKQNKYVVNNKDFNFCILINDKPESNSFVEGNIIKISKINDNTNSKPKVSVTINNETSLNFELNKHVLQTLKQCKQGKLKQNNNEIYIIPNQELQFIKLSKKYKIRLVITSINASYEETESEFNWLNYEGYLFFTNRNSE